MRREDINNLKKPYDKLPSNLFDDRFNSVIKADIPSSRQLVEEIFNDFDEELFGIRWWSSLPEEERILISDYLYQCADDIETNLAEAKLHYLEWLDAREKINEKVANVIVKDSRGNTDIKMPQSISPLDDLPRKLEKMHLCGFFRAIGSSLDCLGATIIGVLALPYSLRKGDIERAKETLSKIVLSDDLGSKLQLDFRDFFETVKKSSGTEDWLEWVVQYRNMLVHRGRRLTHYQIIPRETPFYDSTGRWIPRAKSNMHLAKYPDRSDIEAFVKVKDIILDEDAEITLSGIFQSCKNFSEIICERLVSIWRERRNKPLLLEQPSKQWDKIPKDCKFIGYDSKSAPLNMDLGIGNPSLLRRMLSASVDDVHRKLWDDSKWK